MRLTFDTCLAPAEGPAPWATIALDFDARQRSRALTLALDGHHVRFALPRGAVLRGGDVLRAREDGRLIRIEAAPEPVLDVRAGSPFELLRAAYHLGNRHVPVELTPEYLRLAPDAVLAEMLVQMGARVESTHAPFEPEAGAYQGHGHGHGHSRADDDHPHPHVHPHPHAHAH